MRACCDGLSFCLSPSHPLTLSPSHPLTLTSALEPKDNEWLLSSSEDSSVRLWNLAARTSVCAYRASAESRHPIWDVACNPLGYYFASASHDGTATLWSTEYASPLRRFVGHLSDVDTVRFHPNGLMVATGSLDRSVRLWDVRSGSCVRVLGRAHQHSSRGSASGGSGGHLGGVTALAFSPNGQFLVSGGQDTQLCVWDLPAGKMLTSVPWAGRGELGSGAGFSGRTMRGGAVEFSGTAQCLRQPPRIMLCVVGMRPCFTAGRRDEIERRGGDGAREEIASVADGIGGSLSLGEGAVGSGMRAEAAAPCGGRGQVGGKNASSQLATGMNSSAVVVSSGGGFYGRVVLCDGNGKHRCVQAALYRTNVLVGAGAQVTTRLGPHGEWKDPVVCAV